MAVLATVGERPDAIGWFAAALIAVPVSLIIVGVGLVVITVANRAAAGNLTRNWYAGIRTKATRASDEAWLAAHQAGRAWTVIGGWLLIVAGAAPLLVGALLSPMLSPDQFLALHTAGLLVAVGLGTGAVVKGALDGHRAAKAVAASEPPAS
jgi:uncharacterized membrane protein